MLQIDDWHPDLIDFINVKKTPGMVENANISVRISDAFMDAVKNNLEWELRFPDTRVTQYDEEWDGDIQAWDKKGYTTITYSKHKA